MSILLDVVSGRTAQRTFRGVAQPGSAPAWGAGGRWFKSSRPDHFSLTPRATGPPLPTPGHCGNRPARTAVAASGGPRIAAAMLAALAYATADTLVRALPER